MFSLLLHYLPNLIITSYYLMPVLLVFALYKGRDVPFHWMFLIFGIFLSICGATYTINTWLFWYAGSWVAQLLKFVTILVGISIDVMLFVLLPFALALPSPSRLEAVNMALENEISERLRVEQALSELTKNLEQIVEKRTAQLKDEHQQLQIAWRELQNTQAQLIQAEKMSSLGQLVAGIAHEVNNPVSFIGGNVIHAQQYSQDLLKLIYLYQQHFPQPPSCIQDFIQEIELDFIKKDLINILSSMEMGTKRITEIVLSLRNFSRLDETGMKSVDIHEGLESTLLILQHRLKSNGKFPGVKIIKNYGDLPHIECYPGMLNQVFMNILNNAIDAVIDEFEKHHKLTCKKHTKDCSPRIEIQTQVQDSRSVIIQIIDNGTGIPEEVHQKIFDPFFTTKPVGKGTGLGLSICYQIIDKHNGKLKCLSSPGKSTKFLIELPSTAAQN